MTNWEAPAALAAGSIRWPMGPAPTTTTVSPEHTGTRSNACRLTQSNSLMAAVSKETSGGTR